MATFTYSDPDISKHAEDNSKKGITSKNTTVSNKNTSSSNSFYTDPDISNHAALNTQRSRKNEAISSAKDYVINAAVKYYTQNSSELLDSMTLDKYISSLGYNKDQSTLFKQTMQAMGARTSRGTTLYDDLDDTSYEKMVALRNKSNRNNADTYNELIDNIDDLRSAAYDTPTSDNISAYTRAIKQLSAAGMYDGDAQSDAADWQKYAQSWNVNQTQLKENTASIRSSLGTYNDSDTNTAMDSVASYLANSDYDSAAATVQAEIDRIQKEIDGYGNANAAMELYGSDTASEYSKLKKDVQNLKVALYDITSDNDSANGVYDLADSEAYSTGTASAINDLLTHAASAAESGNSELARLNLDSASQRIEQEMKALEKAGQQNAGMDAEMSAAYDELSKAERAIQNYQKKTMPALQAESKRKEYLSSVEAEADRNVAVTQYITGKESAYADNAGTTVGTSNIYKRVVQPALFDVDFKAGTATATTSFDGADEKILWYNPDDGYLYGLSSYWGNAIGSGASEYSEGDTVDIVRITDTRNITLEDKYDFMTLEERKTYNYLYQKNETEAAYYLSQLEDDLDERQATLNTQAGEDYGEVHPYLGAAVRGGASIVSSVGGLEDWGSALLGYENNTNDIWHNAGRTGTGIMETAAQSANIGGKLYKLAGKDSDEHFLLWDSAEEANDFFYGAVAESVRSAMNFYMAGALAGAGSTTVESYSELLAVTDKVKQMTSALMGSEMLTDSINEELAKGRTPRQAAAIATVRATIEGFTEDKSLGDMINSLYKAAVAGATESGLKKIALGATGVVMAHNAEGVEEVSSNILNNALDIILGDPDNKLTQVQAYHTAGLSWAEAITRACEDTILEDVEAYLGGFLSAGGEISQVAGAAKNAAGSYADSLVNGNQYAQKINEMYGNDSAAYTETVNNLMAENANLRSETGTGKTLTDRAAERTSKKGGAVTAKQASRIAEENARMMNTRDVNTVRSAVESQLEKAGVENAKSAADSMVSALISNKGTDIDFMASMEADTEEASKLRSVWTDLVNGMTTENATGWVGEALQQTTAVNSELKSQRYSATSEIQEAKTNRKGSFSLNSTVSATDDGTTGKIRSFGINDAGQATVTMTANTGETVTKLASDLNLSEFQEALVDGAKQLGGAAKAVMNSYVSGQDVYDYIQSAKAVVAIAQNTTNEERALNTLKSTPIAAGMHAVQIEAVYKAARESMSTEERKETRSNVVRDGNVDTSGISKEDLSKLGNEVEVLQNIAKMAKVDIVLIDSSHGTDTLGNEQGSFTNGVIEIDIYSGLGTKEADSLAKQTMLRTGAHEVTHWLQKSNPSAYRQLQQYVIDTLLEKDPALFYERLNEELEKGSVNGDFDLAFAEITAEACEKVFDDADQLQDLFQKNQHLGIEVWNHLNEFWGKLKSIVNRTKFNRYKGAGNRMANAFDSNYKELREKWAKAFVSAVEQTGSDASTGEIADGAEFVGQDKQMSVRAMTEDYDQYVRDMMDLVDEGVLTNEELNETLASINKFMDVVTGSNAADRKLLDYEPNGKRFAPYKDNADPHYKKALDFSTLCRKRLLQMEVIERLQEKRGKNLSPEMQAIIVRRLQELHEEGYAIETACNLCYVEAARYNSPKWVNKFLEDPGKQVKDYIARRNKDFFYEGKIDLVENLFGVTIEATTKVPTKAEFIAKGGEALYQQWQKQHQEWRAQNRNATKEEYDAKKAEFARDLGMTTEKRRLPTKKQISANYGGGAAVEKFYQATKDLREQYQPTKEEQAAIDRANKYKPETFLTTGNLAVLARRDPLVYNAFTEYVRTHARSKAQESRTEYRHGDISGLTEKVIEQAMSESGIRLQSWSDFEIIHLTDHIASIIELSHAHLAAHTYTKVPAFVKISGRTGIMFNMSMIPTTTGFDEKGNLAFDDIEGMPYNEMIQLRDRFHETAGNIVIGINNDHIRALMNSDIVDYIIPYHKSGLTESLSTILGIKNWSDYSDSQNEKGGTVPLEAWFDIKAGLKAEDGNAFMEASAQKYIDYCNEHGITPKFTMFLKYDVENGWSLDGQKGFWKLLIDRKMVDQTTNKIIEQKAVRPVFNQNAINDEVASVLGGDQRQAFDAALDEIIKEIATKDTRFFSAEHLDWAERFMKNEKLMDISQSALEAYAERKASAEGISKEQAMSDIKMSEVKNALGNGRKQYSTRETTDGRKVAVVDDDILSGLDLSNWTKDLVATAKSAAKSALSKFIDGYPNGSIVVHINRTSRREFTRSDYTAFLSNKEHDKFIDKMRAASIADDIIVSTTGLTRDGKLKHDRTDNLVDFMHGNVLLQSGENQYKCTVVLGITQNGEYIFYDVTDMNPTSFVLKEESEATSTGFNNVPDINSSFASDMNSTSTNDESKEFSLRDNPNAKVGINISNRVEQIVQRIQSGTKTIETRNSPSLRKYVGQTVGIVSTNDKRFGGKATVVGYAKILEEKYYGDEKSFRNDEALHGITADSEYDISKSKTGHKYGYVLQWVKDEENPYQVTEKGIVARDIDREAQKQYSIREIIKDDGTNLGKGVYLDSTLLSGLTDKERIQIVKQYVKELAGSIFEAEDSNGNHISVTIEDSSKKFKNSKGNKVPFNNDLYRKNINFKGKQEAIALIDELITTSSYDKTIPSKKSHDWVDNYGKSKWEYWTTYIQDKNNTIWAATLNITTTADGKKILYDIDPINKEGRAVNSATVPSGNIVSQSETKSQGQNSERETDESRQVRGLEREIKQLKSELEKFKGLKTENKIWQQEFKRLSKEYDRYSDEMDTRVSELQETVDQQDEDNATLEKEFKRLSRAYDTKTRQANREQAKLEDRISERENDITELEADSKILSDELNRLLTSYDRDIARKEKALEEIKERQKEQAEAKKAKNRRDYYRNRIVKLAQKLQQQMVNPTSTSYVPASLRDGVEEILNVLNTDAANMRIPKAELVRGKVLPYSRMNQKQKTDLKLKMDAWKKTHPAYTATEMEEARREAAASLGMTERDQYRIRISIDNVTETIFGDTEQAVREKASALLMQKNRNQENTMAYHELSNAIRRLGDEYRALKDSEDSDIMNSYDEAIQQALTELASSCDNTPVRLMTAEQMEDVYRVLKTIQGTLSDARKLINGVGNVTASVKARTILNEMRDATARDKGLIKKVKLNQSTLSPMRLARMMAGYKQNSVWEDFVEQLDDGRKQGDAFRMECMKLFTPLMTGSNKRTYTEAVNNMLTVKWTQPVMDEDGDQKVRFDGLKYTPVTEEHSAELTLMQAMQIYMSWRRELSNPKLEHMSKGGIILLDQNLLNKGKRIEAANAGTKLNHISPEFMEQIDEMISGNKWAQDYIAAAEEVFNRKAKDALNEAMVLTRHMIVAGEGYYIPFSVDSREVVNDLGELKLDATIDGKGMLKSLKQSAKQHIVISGLNSVLAQHIKDTAQVKAYAVVQRDWNKVWSASAEDVDDGTLPEKFHAQLTRIYGEDVTKIFSEVISDISNARRAPDANKWWNKAINWLNNKFVISTLYANVSVTIKQAASYAAAGAVLSQEALAPYQLTIAKLFAKPESKYAQNLFAEIDAHTATHWTRREGLNGIPEMADVKVDTNIFDKVADKINLPTAMNPMRWIQNMDVATTATLWLAAKKQVELDGIKETDENYWESVTALYDKTIGETQPMYDVLHRPDVQKATNAVFKQLYMFKTQPVQNHGIMNNAIGEMQAAQLSDDSAWKKQAARKLAMAVISQVASATVYSAMTMVAYMVRHKSKRYRDDETGEMTLASVMARFAEDWAGSLVGVAMPIGGSELWSAIENWVSKSSYDSDVFSVPIVEDLNDLIQDTSNLIKSMTPDDDGDLDWDTAKSRIADMVFTMTGFFGIPLQNAYNIVSGAIGNVNDIVNGAVPFFNEVYSERSKSQQYNRMVEAMHNGSHEKFDAVYADLLYTMTEAGKSERKAKSTIESGLTDKIKTLFEEGKISDTQAEEWLKDYCGKYSGDAADTVDGWKIKAELGYSLSEAKEKYYSGEITEEDLHDLYVTYGGKSEEDATDIVNKAKCYVDTGIDYDDLGDAYMDGGLSFDKAVEYRMTYGGQTEANATTSVTGWKFESETGVSGATSKAVSLWYSGDFENSSLSAADYVKTYNELYNTHGENRQANLIAAIAKLNLTAEQKDALYMTAGGYDSISDKAKAQMPWH